MFSISCLINVLLAVSLELFVKMTSNFGVKSLSEVTPPHFQCIMKAAAHRFGTTWWRLIKDSIAPSGRGIAGVSPVSPAEVSLSIPTLAKCEASLPSRAVQLWIQLL